jgi:hypothetical protein
MTMTSLAHPMNARPGRRLIAAAGGVMLAGALTAAAHPPAHLAARGFPGLLNGVSAVSASDAWAVGTDGSGHGLIVHWNGSTWKQVPSPNNGGVDILSAVAATSASDAWAVGGESTSSDPSGVTLIVHWNGSAWKQVPSPSPNSPNGDTLTGVAATSATNAWAVGESNLNGRPQPLILHWNGTAWKQVPSPNPPGFANSLNGVAATSASNAWAAGSYATTTNPEGQPLILHWNGTTWKQVPSPNPNSKGANNLAGVAATSATSAWAAGWLGNGDTLIVGWNGSAWKQVPSPTPPSETGDLLHGVAATSASNAWAVGNITVKSSAGPFIPNTLIVRWNGTAWQRVPSPNPNTKDGDFLHAVAASSASDAWAVGGTDTPQGANLRTVILHWNGTAWG